VNGAVAKVVQLDSWDLKKWRKRLGYNQFEAAKRLGVHRGAVQNWEREVRPVPLTVELACEELEREHQSLNQESVLLVCTDGPIVQPSNAPYYIPLLRCEMHVSSEVAIKTACNWRRDPTLTNSMIFSSEGALLWEPLELLRECEKRDLNLSN